MNSESATKMAAIVQPTTIPARALTDMVIPWPLLSPSGLDVDEMVGEAGAPGLGVVVLGSREESAETAPVGFKLVDGSSVVVVEEEDVFVEVAGAVVTGCSAEAGQPTGICWQGSTRQQPL